MAAELVSAATSNKLTEVDWTKSIEICELVARDHRQAKDVIKSIKKRVGSKNANTQLFAVILLEVLMNNIGEPIHKQVIDTGLLPVLVKIVKKKSDPPVREKIFLLLDATQTSLGGASGRFPQYCSAYYDLSAGVQFPQRPPTVPTNPPSSNTNQNKSTNGERASSGQERNAPQPEPHIVPESCVIKKAGATLEVLREVLDAVDTKNPKGANDEFTLDLVEQCSFQKRRVMHLAMSSRDEKVISQAVELNDQLQKVLARHDTLISGRSTSSSNQLDQEDVDEEEEAEQLFQRIRKGKACVQPEDENRQPERPLGLLESSIPGEMLHRPLIRPLTVEPKQEPNLYRPVAPAVGIPPPLAKHVEREKKIQEKKSYGSTLAGHVRGLSLRSRSTSGRHSESLDSSD